MQINQTVTDPKRRHDFILLFDVQDGNPNGDPDAGNLPRVDPETMHGIVTDVSLKRKVRDWVDAAHGEEERYKIYVQRLTYLYDKQKRAYAALNIAKSSDTSRVSEAGRWMCENFYDIRMFGAVMGTKEYNCGQVRGPLQLTFARSVDPIVQMDLSLTRVALTKPGDRPDRADDVEGDEAPTFGTMGRKALVLYGLYKGYGFFTPRFAQDTGATREDLELFWTAMANMWDLDRSSSRGLQACRGLYVFSHDNALGNAPAHELLERVRVRRQAPADLVERPARAFADYAVELELGALPDGVTLTRIVG
jgi:CRISPR-associated protein Csd2